MKPQQLFLPGGLCIDGKQCYQDIQLRQITGKDEELVATGYNIEKNISAIILFLISRCVESIGPITEITENTVRQLLVADRDYLVLKLRQITFGNKVRSTVVCQNQSCGKMMDIEFNIDDIPVNAKNVGNGTFTVKLSESAAYRFGNEKHDLIEFRLPNIGDLEYVSKIAAAENYEKAVIIALARCIKKLGNISEITEDLVSSLPLLARNEIEESIRNLSPHVDLEMEIQCPECKHRFSSSFDIYHFLYKK